MQCCWEIHKEYRSSHGRLRPALLDPPQFFQPFFQPRGWTPSGQAVKSKKPFPGWGEFRCSATPLRGPGCRPQHSITSSPHEPMQCDVPHRRPAPLAPPVHISLPATESSCSAEVGPDRGATLQFNRHGHAVWRGEPALGSVGGNSVHHGVHQTDRSVNSPGAALGLQLVPWVWVGVVLSMYHTL